VVFLYLGELVEKAGMEKFFEDPDNERTEQFIAGETIVDTQ
jgi:ABC-type phosphate transport system ATPase subunit